MKWNLRFKFICFAVMCLLAPIAKATVLLQLWGLDFTGNHVLTDAESFPKAPPANVLPAVEFSSGTWKTQTIAYTRGASITANVTIKNPRAESFTGTLNVNGVLYIPQARYDGWSLFPMVLPTTTPTINLAIPAGGTQTFTLNFVGFPTVVSFGELNIDWNAQGSWGGGASTHAFGPVPGDYDFFGWVYGLFSTPVDLQTIPWVEVLWETCTYATGASTQAELSELLVKGLYWGSGIVYEPDDSKYWSSGTSTFLLTDWIYKKNGNLGDCMTCAAAVDLFHAAHGVYVTMLRLEASNGPDGQSFLTRFVSGIGNDASIYIPGSTYDEFEFGFHQIAFAGGHVLDAAIAQHLSPSGAAHYNPVYDWGVSSYWQTPPNGLVRLPDPAIMYFEPKDVLQIL
jgi:hypothetical protein